MLRLDFNDSARRILDWWQIDETAISQHPLRAVGDALCLFVKRDDRGEQRLPDSFSHMIMRTGQNLVRQANGHFPIPVQLTFAAAGIDAVTGFINRRCILEGEQPDWSKIPPSQVELSPQRHESFAQTTEALDLLALELGQMRCTIGGPIPESVMAEVRKKVILLRQHAKPIRPEFVLVPATAPVVLTPPRGTPALVR
jgi:hypothetical protein